MKRKYWMQGVKGTVVSAALVGMLLGGAGDLKVAAAGTADGSETLVTSKEDVNAIESGDGEAEQETAADYPEATKLNIDAMSVDFNGVLKDTNEMHWYMFEVPAGKSMKLTIKSEGKGIGDPVEKNAPWQGSGGGPLTGNGVNLFKKEEGHTIKTCVRSWFKGFGTQEYTLNEGTYYLAVMAVSYVATRSQDEQGNEVYINYHGDSDPCYASYGYTVNLKFEEVEDVAQGKQNGPLFKNAVEVERNKTYSGVLGLSNFGSPFPEDSSGNATENYKIVVDGKKKIKISLSDYDPGIVWTEIRVYKEGERQYYAEEIGNNLNEEGNPTGNNLEIELEEGVYYIYFFFSNSIYVEETDLGAVTYKFSIADMNRSLSDLFKDIQETDWWYPFVLYVYENGIMSGTGENFEPLQTIPREQFVQILYNHSGKPDANGIENGFSDVEDKWYKSAVLWANKNGITSGYDDGRFGVGDKITREQIAVMLYKYAQIKKFDLAITDGYCAQYAGSEKVDSWAKEAMDWLTTQGIMSGKGTSTDKSKLDLDPLGYATRAECAAMITNLLKKNNVE